MIVVRSDSREVRVKRLLVLLALAVMALLVVAPAAQAQGNVKGGITTLKIDSGTAAALGDAGISVSRVLPARGEAPQFKFPITGGNVTTDPVHGRIKHSGGLKFSGGGNSLVVKRFYINLERGILTAYVPAADARVPLLKLSGGQADLEGHEITLTNVTAKLTPEAAAALNDTFSTDLFEGGLLIGKTNTVARV